MQTAKQNLRWLQSGTLALRLQLPIPKFMAAAFLLMAASGIATLALVTVTRVTQPLNNPFAQHADLWTLETMREVLDYGFGCRVTFRRYSPGSSSFCAQHEADSPFYGRYIGLTGDRVKERSFSPQPDTLRLGDLVLLWGKPELRLYCDVPVVTWPERHIWLMARPLQNGYISYFSPVVGVSFTSGGSPFWEQSLAVEMLETCGSITRSALRSRPGR